MARRFAENVPFDIEQKLRKYMETRGYSQGTIEMRIGNLGYLFEVFGSGDLLELLNTGRERAQRSVDYVIDHLPPNGMHSADIQAFKLAWESIHEEEEELFKKRVRPRVIV